MDAHHLESPPPDSDQTLNTSPHDSPPQTLDDLPISTSLSPTRDEILHDQPDPASLVDYDAPEGDDEEEKEDALRSPSPPSYYVSAFSSSSHWSSAPWSSAKGTRDSGWPSWVSKADAKPSKYDWPETWLSAGAGDAKAFESDWSDPFAFEGETEPEPLAACDDTKPAMVVLSCSKSLYSKVNISVFPFGFGVVMDLVFFFFGKLRVMDLVVVALGTYSRCLNITVFKNYF